MNDNIGRLAELIAEDICRSFASVTRDDGTTLHEAEVIDAHGSDAEQSAARERDPDRRWQDVPDHLIESHSDTLCFLNPKGFRYYLPAYIVWTLRHFRTSDSLSVNHAIYSLTISEVHFKKKWEYDIQEWQLERFRLFTDDQARAICCFLRFISDQADYVDTGEAGKALDRYWGKFCGPLG